MAHIFDEHQNQNSGNKRKAREEDELTVDINSLQRLTKKIGTKIEMMILDKASMIGLEDLAKWDARLKQVVSNGGDQPFAIIHIIFVGDFLQYPGVLKQALFARVNIKWKSQHVAGYNLWRSINAVVILIQIMRQAEDPYYGQLLHDFRSNDVEKILKHFKMLQKRVISSSKADKDARLKDFTGVPIFVRMALNFELTRKYA